MTTNEDEEIDEEYEEKEVMQVSDDEEYENPVKRAKTAKRVEKKTLQLRREKFLK